MIVFVPIKAKFFAVSEPTPLHPIIKTFEFPDKGQKKPFLTSKEKVNLNSYEFSPEKTKAKQPTILSKDLPKKLFETTSASSLQNVKMKKLKSFQNNDNGIRFRRTFVW